MILSKPLQTLYQKTGKKSVKSGVLAQSAATNYMRMANMIPELEDLQDENSKLRALISNNFGRRKNDPEKDRKALVTYVELKGFKHGEIGGGHQRVQNGLSAMTLDEIAKELNISKTNLKRALSIERNLTDSMKELLDTGVITKTLAADTI